MALDNTFCRACGYELDLAIADFQGEAAELEDEFDYERTLGKLGLSGERAPAAPWGTLALILALIVLGLALTLWRAA